MKIPNWIMEFFHQNGRNRQRVQIEQSHERVNTVLHEKLEEAIDANARASTENDRVKHLLEGVLSEARGRNYTGSK